jgi:hypothetical protein
MVGRVTSCVPKGFDFQKRALFPLARRRARSDAFYPGIYDMCSRNVSHRDFGGKSGELHNAVTITATQNAEKNFSRHLDWTEDRKEFFQTYESAA